MGTYLFERWYLKKLKNVAVTIAKFSLTNSAQESSIPVQSFLTEQ